MARAQYFVVRERDQWRINHSGNLYGYYPSADAARQVAIATAQKAVAAGLVAEVLEEGDGGSFRRVWEPGDELA